MLEIRRLTRRFSVMQFSYWAMWSSFYSFAGLYLSHNGMSYALIGVTMSAAVLSGIAGRFFWGYLCDRFHAVKKVFLIANAAIWITILLLCQAKGQFSSVLLMTALGFSLFPQPAILDSWILNQNRSGPLDYGFIRMWASIGYSIFALITGIAIKAHGFSVMPIFSSIFLLITAVTALLTPDIAYQGIQRPKAAYLKESYRRLFTSGNYLSFLCICFLIGLGLQTMDNLMPLIVESAGGDPDHLGWIIFVSAVTEIPIFLLSAKIQKKFSHRACFCFAITLFAMKFAVMIAVFTPGMLALGMAFQGVGFAVFLPCMRFYAYQNAPPDLATSAQTITDCVTNGFAGAIASLFGGAAIQFLGAKALLAACLAMTLLSLIWALSKRG